MTEDDVIIPPGSAISYERFHFAPAVRAGDTVYCSGVIGAVGATVPDDPAEEFTNAFQALRDLLAAAGGSLNDVVELTTFHVDMGTHLRAFIAAKDAAFPRPYPAWTAIGCTELALPGARAEIKATAVIPES
ncbi:MAG: RidA family protein [Acidimicrobiia bacterium]|nr:RidA family protein [Acidimicrobiia bacterium]MDH4365494.1 RidA family protein [Acidimicrobiia bacterium]MDH5291863.1 RidA family protein [Acidimicrobiia bacterium]